VQLARFDVTEKKMEANSTIAVFVGACVIEAQTVRSFELRPVDTSEPLPTTTAGAHIDVFLPNAIVRQYSVTNPGDRRSYRIAVHRDPNSRGGSSSLHDQIRVGDKLHIGVPRNNFELNEAADQSVLVAGGIGITPIYAMVARLTELQKPWTLYYCARSFSAAAFVSELEHIAATATNGRLVMVLDDAPNARLLDLQAVIAEHGPAAHYYCCGPIPLLNAFTRAAAELPTDQVHVEYFSATEIKREPGNRSAFNVYLARSGLTLKVLQNETILEAVLRAGVPVLNSCREGICGSCETAVLAGQPEHLDQVLSAQEKESNRTMMICVSRCKGEQLTLDL
jgi:tetrachlorobenzoquinone reductase